MAQASDKWKGLEPEWVGDAGPCLEPNMGHDPDLGHISPTSLTDGGSLTSGRNIGEILKPFLKTATRPRHDGTVQAVEGEAEDLKRRFPKFCAALPSAALQWPPEVLDLFLASGGFLTPDRRSLARMEIPQLAMPGILKPPPSLANLKNVLASETPKIIWAYWNNWESGLSHFHFLCLESWRRKNPGWVLAVLNGTTISNYMDVEKDLPNDFHNLKGTQQADAVRLALLDIHGGVWTDVTSICIRPLDDFCYGVVSDRTNSKDFAAFNFVNWDETYVENWFLAARRGHPFLHKWREVFTTFWNDFRKGGYKMLYEHPMFVNVNLSHLVKFGCDNRHYLSMHSSFAKVVQEDSEMRRIFDNDMYLMKADDSALWHLEEMKWNNNAANRKWLNPDDTWLQHVLQHCPILKFPLDAYLGLQSLDFKNWLLGDGCMCALFREVLGFDRDGFIAAQQNLENIGYTGALDMKQQLLMSNFAAEKALAQGKWIEEMVQKMCAAHNAAKSGEAQPNVLPGYPAPPTEENLASRGTRRYLIPGLFALTSSMFVLVFIKKFYRCSKPERDLQKPLLLR